MEGHAQVKLLSRITENSLDLDKRMQSPPHPSVPALTRARARHVDLFAVLGWPSSTHTSSEIPSTVRSGNSRRTTSSGSPLSSPPSTASQSSRCSLTNTKRESGGLFDAYDDESVALPEGALIVKASTLDSIKQPEALTRHFDRPPSPQPYTIRSVANTHYLIEKDGLPIWIEKDSCSLSTPTGDGEDEKSGPALPTSRIFTPREFIFVLNVCLAQFFSLAALAQTWAPLLDVARALHITQPGLMAWPTAAYSLTLGSCILPAGRLGDMYGHKKLFLIGWVWFALASVVCGFSSAGGFEMLTGCRALQGIGPALLVPNGLALLARNFPMGVKRNLAISLFGGSGPVGVVFGAVFSSLLGQLASWKWSYWCLAIATALLAVLSYLIIPVDAIPAQPSRPHNEFDFLGACTGVGGLVLFNFGLNQAPITGWGCSYIGVTLGLGILMMCTFVYIELKVARHPLIPLKGIKKDAALTLACIAAGWGSHGMWLYYMFLLIEQVRKHTPLEACLRFWPVAPVGLAAALSVSFLLKKFRIAHLMSTAMLCFLAGCLLLVTAPADQGYFPNTFLSVIITPFGMNWSFPTGVILMSNAVHREHQGIAASLVATMVNYSISTGLGFAGSVERYVSADKGTIAGYRAAWSLGVGLAGTGFLISLYFIWQTRMKK